MVCRDLITAYFTWPVEQVSADSKDGYRRMIESKLNRSSGQGHIVMCPNRSADWCIIKLLLWLISSIALLIGTGFAMAGLWLILPFSGLEVLGLVSLLYWVSHECYRQQVIHLEGSRVIVEKGHRTPQSAWESELFWTRLIVEQSPFLGHPEKLFLRSKQQQLEIGEFLNEGDKKKLLSELRGVITVVND